VLPSSLAFPPGPSLRARSESGRILSIIARASLSSLISVWLGGRETHVILVLASKMAHTARDQRWYSSIESPSKVEVATSDFRASSHSARFVAYTSDSPNLEASQLTRAARARTTVRRLSDPLVMRSSTRSSCNSARASEPLY
jgi:hypothetical protein